MGKDDAQARCFVRKSGRMAWSQTWARLSSSRISRDHAFLVTTTRARSGFGDINPVVEIAAKRQRKLVEQQVLRCEVWGFRQAIEGWIVAVHVFVETFHNIRKRLDMGHFGLLPVPFGESIGLAQIIGIGDATFAPCIQRIFQLI